MSGLIHRMPFGAEPVDGGVRFRLWAPDAREVSLLLEGPQRNSEVLLDGVGGGWREAVVTEAASSAGAPSVTVCTGSGSQGPT